ncbi:MAG TPA: LysR family transcriptional regulator [Albitalea sp.]|nr:LysR family transcriptional regulator [Albitalea sp.]
MSLSAAWPTERGTVSWGLRRPRRRRRIGLTVGARKPFVHKINVRQLISHMNHTDLDLNLLRVFRQVYLLRNVRSASERLGLSQPAVSHAIARLRLVLKDALFVRAPGGVAPTAKADHFARYVEAALKTIDTGLDEADRFDPARTQRRFVMHMSDLGEGEFLPHLMSHLRKVAPGVRLASEQLAPEQILPAMEQGRIDLAVGYLPQLDGVHEQPMFEDQYVLVTRKGHPRVRPRSKALQLDALDYIVVQGHTDPARALLRLGLEARISLTIPHFQVLPEILAQTDLAAIVPLQPARRFAQRYELQVTAFEAHLPPLRVGLHWIWRVHDDPGHRWLRESFATLFTPPRR